ncbi:uncharacterized protein YegP (UPF0339 family) [Arthrobacter sp. V1I9]|jgi:uncharacterized protein YegP (UPF0339 family)|uniref:YegP family protein n=1 Tax=Arthrobacter sp. V1I9 TaxID=3042275 RepID=UPI00278FA515|nr:DUF1508 domain-containing protein [Arthrobacter sp. V1I9]MDQ0870588.1 uncharacterized protein YegP (UPF0339 family) [Arthrobacter sp. V1I9]
MAGKFEAFVDQESFFRFRLLAPDGAVMAVSGPFEDKAALAAGIAAVRECAGTGLVTDLCPAGAVARPAPAGAPVLAPAAAPADCEDRRTPAGHTFVLAKGPRRQGTKPRWTTAIAR